MERGISPLDEFFVRAAAKHRPRVCFIATGSGDSEHSLGKFYKTITALDGRPSHLAFFRKPRPGAIPLDRIEKGLLTQDAIYVGGGNTRAMLAVWREWGVDNILRTAWNNGVLLGGVSAGAICWFEYGATDSVLGPGRSTALRCLGLLPGSCSPHFDSEPRRRPDFHRLIARGELPPGIGIDDGVAVLFHDRRLIKVLSARPGATAYRVARKSGMIAVRPYSPTPVGSERSIARNAEAKPK